MKDRDLDQLLRDLPRERASLGFKTRVLARVGGSAPRRRRQRPVRWGLATAAALAIAVGTVSWRDASRDRREEIARMEETRRIEAMRSEYRDLEQELRHLRRLVAASEPVVGVEGNGEYDYVFDLHEITRARGGDAFPVSYRLPE